MDTVNNMDTVNGMVFGTKVTHRVTGHTGVVVGPSGREVVAVKYGFGIRNNQRVTDLETTHVPAYLASSRDADIDVEDVRKVDLEAPSKIAPPSSTAIPRDLWRRNDLSHPSNQYNTFEEYCEKRRARELAVLDPDQQKDIAQRTKVERPEKTLEQWLDEQITKIALQPYGHYAAKFEKYPWQHPTDRANVEGSVLDIYKAIAAICAKKLGVSVRRKTFWIRNLCRIR